VLGDGAERGSCRFWSGRVSVDLGVAGEAVCGYCRNEAEVGLDCRGCEGSNALLSGGLGSPTICSQRTRVDAAYAGEAPLVVDGGVDREAIIFGSEFGESRSRLLVLGIR